MGRTTNAKTAHNLAIEECNGNPRGEYSAAWERSLTDRTNQCEKRLAALLEAAETVITATTSSEPVLPNEEGLLRGRHFVGIGSFKPTMREFPEALFHLVSRVFVDTEHASVESGDLAVPLREGWIQRERVVPLGRLLTGAETFADLHRETTLFKSVGMALFDLCAAGLIYRKALVKGLGQRIELGGG